MRTFQIVLGGFLAALVLLAGAALLPPPSTAAQIETERTAQQMPVTIIAPDSAAVETIWRNWMARHGIEQGTMALGQNGAILSTADAGRSSDTPYPVASLSKAVTAMCMNKLLAQSPYDWSTPLAALTPVWDAFGTAPHPALGALPLSALVTHTSGLPKNIDTDETGQQGRNLYTQIHFARMALRDPAHLGEDRTHLYSNVNFALLGQIIEGLSGQPYGDYCHETVMAPAGATTAQVAGPMWATAGFGGWSVSATDYARFLMYWFAPDQPWMRDPFAYPLDQGSGAGLGVFNRRVDGHHMLNHSGLWRSKTASRRIGALLVTSDTGAVFVSNWQGSLPPEAYSDLRQSIAAALH